MPINHIQRTMTGVSRRWPRNLETASWLVAGIVLYGAALGIHPLAVLIVTIVAGSLFGAAGVILAAPVTSAITRIASDLAADREREQRGAAAEKLSTP